MTSTLTAATERQRKARLIRLVAASVALPLIVTLVLEAYSGARPINMLAQAGGLAAVAAAAILSRTRHLDLAAVILPVVGWILANTVVLLSPSASPLFIVSVNIPVALLAGTLLGHGGLAIFALLSAAASAAMALAASYGLVELGQSGVLNWATAGLILALSMVLGFQAFRSGRLALDQAEQGAKELDTLRQAGMAVTASLELEETIQRILEQLNRVVPYDSASVQVLRPGYMEIVGGRGWDDVQDVVGIRFPIPGDNPNTIVVQTGAPYKLDNAPEAHPSFAEPPHDHIRSWLGVPLEIGDQLTGMLSVESEELAHFSARDVHMVATFADQVAIALRNAHSFRAEQRQRRMTAAVSQIAQIMGSSLDMETALHEVCRLTAVAAHADQCAIFVGTEGTQDLALHTLRGPNGELDSNESQAAEDVFRQLLAGGEAGQVLAAGVAEQVPAGATDKYEPVSIALLTPLISRGEPLGMLLLRRTTAVEPFDDAQFGAAATVATTLAGYIRAARLFARTQELATTDPLTGLFNRRGWLQAGLRELDRAERYGRPLATLILDLDLFKRVNDSYGHPVGDEVLRETADRLRSCLRKIDLIGRYGGEEFMALLPECDLPSAEMVAQRVRRAVEAPVFATSAGDVQVTTSIGVASSEVEPLDLDALLRAADRALYSAKDGGRNQVCAAIGEGQIRRLDPAG
jgi:diguanylate cyclase (GGDEF)-like protein